MREKLIRDERDDDTNENKYTNLIGTQPGVEFIFRKPLLYSIQRKNGVLKFDPLILAPA